MALFEPMRLETLQKFLALLEAEGVTIEHVNIMIESPLVLEKVADALKSGDGIDRSVNAKSPIEALRISEDLAGRLRRYQHTYNVNELLIKGFSALKRDKHFTDQDVSTLTEALARHGMIFSS